MEVVHGDRRVGQRGARGSGIPGVRSITTTSTACRNAGLRAASQAPTAALVRPSTCPQGLLAGDVDEPGLPRIRALPTDPPVFVVDLDGVQYLASVGLRVLIEAKYFAAEHDSELQVVCHSPSVNLVFDGSGLRDHFTFADSVALALGQ